jgi:hypothetical protein
VKQPSPRAGRSPRPAHWLVRHKGRLLGPATLPRIESWIRARCVPQSAELGLVGRDEWVPLHRALPRVEPEVGVSGPPPPPPRRHSTAVRGAATLPGLMPATASLFDDDDEVTLVRKTGPRRTG